VIYVQGCWLSSFNFKVASTRFELKDDFSGLDVRIFLEALLEHVHITMLPLSFQPFSLEVTKDKMTIFLLRSATFVLQIHISALADGWNTTPGSKLISLGTSSSHMVKLVT